MITKLTDQPGRLLAVVLFGPIIVYKSIKYGDTLC